VAEAKDLPVIDPVEQLVVIGQAVITTDPLGVVLFWNAAARGPVRVDPG